MEYVLHDNEIDLKNIQTPIEIALEIDKYGMTTAKKLYAFLELSPAAYARWYKNNIVNNQFAEENVDYEVFNIDVENPQGGRPTQDFKLTAHFAKKLSMMQKNEKGEQAREYFARIEENKKQEMIDQHQLSPQTQLMNLLVQTISKQELEQKRQAEQIEKIDKKVDSIREVVAIDTTSWREKTNNILRKIGLDLGGGKAYSQVRATSYDLLERRMAVNLNQRLINKRRRVEKDGASNSKINSLSYLDIIEDDKKLIEGYMSIVKEMAIKYGVA